MSRKTFNPKLFETFGIPAFVEQVTGQSMELCVTEQLQALGLTWFPALDAAYTAIVCNIDDQVMAAFEAGYRVGRNPDLLLMAMDDGGEGDE